MLSKSPHALEWNAGLVRSHAAMMCWFTHVGCSADPQTLSQQKALETIGANLQRQYERWQPRARYKQSLDPTVDEVKKLCTSLRRNAKVISASML
jgi:hypothetical protein